MKYPWQFWVLGGFAALFTVIGLVGLTQGRFDWLVPAGILGYLTISWGSKYRKERRTADEFSGVADAMQRAMDEFRDGSGPGYDFISARLDEDLRRSRTELRNLKGAQEGGQDGL